MTHRTPTSPIFSYPYARSREALDSCKSSEAPDAWDGVKLRYINPLTGGWPMPTIATFMQLLPAGFAGKTYRATDGAVYSVVEGHGTAEIGGQRIRLRAARHFVVPSWAPLRLSARRRHACCSVFRTVRCSRRWASCARPFSRFPEPSLRPAAFFPTHIRLGRRSPPCLSSFLLRPSLASPSPARRTCFPVHRIYCVGRNYAAHAREMGFDPDREPPFFFCKPADAVLPVAAGETGEHAVPAADQGTTTTRSNWSWRSARAAATLPVDDAPSTSTGYAVGLDMTRRDLQDEDARAGPPLGNRQGLRSFGAGRRRFVPLPKPARSTQGAISLEVDGEDPPAERLCAT